MSGDDPFADRPIKGRYVLTYRGQLAATWGQSRLLRIIAICSAVVLVFELVCQSLFWAFDQEDSMLASISYLLLFVAGWFALIGYGVWRLSPQQRDITYVIDDERIVMRDAAGNEMSSPWREVSALTEARAGFVVRVGHARRWLAASGFSPEATAAFRALARERLGAKARVLG